MILQRRQEQHAQSVVLSRSEPMPASLDLLDAQVEASVGPLEVPVSWWARISVRHEASVLPSDRTSGTSSTAQPAIALSSKVAASAGLSAR
jgi:hypothetical protein